MSKMRSLFRAMKREGMPAAEAWRIVKETTEQDAKRLQWPDAMLADALHEYFGELQAAYPASEVRVIVAAEMEAERARRATAPRSRRFTLRSLLAAIRGVIVRGLAYLAFGRRV